MYKKNNSIFATKTLEEHGVTIAQLVMCPDTLMEACDKNLSQTTMDILALLINIYGEPIDVFNSRIKGKSRCRKEDTFNPEIGNELALCRAEKKYYAKRARQYSKYADMLTQAAKELTRLAEQCDGKMNKCERRINNILEKISE